jgi:putative SOS response-associated peptidase YedK
LCNLYSLTKGQAAIRDWFRARHDRTGNLPLFPGIFPDQTAPIVRNDIDGERELVMARWGMPGSPQYGGAPVTNIRNLDSPHWRGWLGRHHRCLVPASSFCEYADTRPRKTPIWFALDEDRPLFAFAGLWMRWRGVRMMRHTGDAAVTPTGTVRS